MSAPLRFRAQESAPPGAGGHATGPRRRSRLFAAPSVATSTDADLRVQIALHPRSERLNRAVNMILAAVLLVLLTPVLVIVALAIKLSSPGPILYRQTRIGLDRRHRGHGSASSYDRRVRDLGGAAFVIFKFRSMYADAERKTGAVWASKDDPRITPVGRLLRKTRLDELPQLANVLRGDMNIVGPRPERPSIVERLRNDIEEYGLRHLARPGITGWAQVNRCYDSCLDDVREKVRYDLEYLTRQGLAEDVGIMLRTIPVVFFRRGGW